MRMKDSACSCGSSGSASSSVSRNPWITVSGVFISCDTLATKSRRIVSSFSSWVMSRVSSSFWSSPKATTRSCSVRPGWRGDAIDSGSP